MVNSVCISLLVLFADLAVIKYSKSDGGNVGMTHKNPAVMWWSLVRHITGQYVKVKIDDEYTDKQSKDKEHASLQPSELKQDAEHVRRIIEEHQQVSMFQ